LKDNSLRSEDIYHISIAQFTISLAFKVQYVQNQDIYHSYIVPIPLLCLKTL